MGVQEEKAALRRQFRAQRTALLPEDAARWDKAIADHLLQSEAFCRADVVFCYLAVKDEVATAPIVQQALVLGKQVAAPVCGPGGQMEFKLFEGPHQLAPGRFGIAEPLESCPVAAATAHSLCLVPGLAFDRQGLRLGYGGGYYDRFLPRFAGRAVGLVRSGFLVQQLPAGRFDCKVQALVTENGWLDL